MLEARMDRQKFSKMMERSDFMNLTGHSWQRQRRWCLSNAGWLATSHPTRHPTYLQKAA
jgi:hypothetical protein